MTFEMTKVIEHQTEEKATSPARRNVTDTANAVSKFLRDRQHMVDGIRRLTPREREFFRVFRETEFDTKITAERMGISPKTGDIFWAKIRRKLGKESDVASSYQIVHFMAVYSVSHEVD